MFTAKFSPTYETILILENTPKPQLSNRINELILKGAKTERLIDIEQSYKIYSEALAQEKTIGFSNDDDNVEDFI